MDRLRSPIIIDRLGKEKQEAKNDRYRSPDVVDMVAHGI